MGNSIAEIFSNIERKLPIFLSHCTDCKRETHHERIEKLLMLPEVLIVNLERFQTTRSGRTTTKNCKDIKPSIIVTIDETYYTLKAVVTHSGRRANANEIRCDLLRY